VRLHIVTAIVLTAARLRGNLCAATLTLVLAILAIVAASCDDGSGDAPGPALTRPIASTTAPATATISPADIATPVPISDQPPVSHGFADIGEGQLYYEIYGTGEPLLLIPGLSANHLSWAEQVGRFSTAYRVIIYDPRGTGQSSPIPDGYDTKDMADDASALLDALGLGAVHVYGASMGGMVAQELTLRHPEHVATLVVGGTTPGGPDAAPAENWALTVFIGQPDPEGEGRSILDVLYSPEFIRDHPERIAQGLGLIGEYPVTRIEVIAAQLLALSGHNVYERLPQINVPTLVLHGTDDPLIPAENGHLIAEQIPDAQLILYEGARHSYRTEVFPQGDDDVLAFLAEHPLAAEGG
jgi:pimeloyl-ACP methyl ester carboxylesterase